MAALRIENEKMAHLTKKRGAPYLKAGQGAGR
jgi:hypothetical protein